MVSDEQPLNIPMNVCVGGVVTVRFLLIFAVVSEVQPEKHRKNDELFCDPPEIFVTEGIFTEDKEVQS